MKHLNQNKMTAVEYLLDQMFNHGGLKKEQGVMYISPELVEKAKKMEIEQSQEYAGFTVECYKMDIPLITFDSYIKL